MSHAEKNKKQKQKRYGRETAMGFLFCSPYIIYFLILFLIPLIWAFWLSGMDWNLMSANRVFVGLQNFIDAFKDTEVIAVRKGVPLQWL